MITGATSQSVGSVGVSASDIAQFVEGLRRHDLAKSVLLEQVWHARSGFSLLACCGAPLLVQLTVLLHTHEARTHLSDLPGHISTIPFIVFYGSQVDRLASSSLGSRSDENSKDWSRQNPWSRIPIKLPTRLIENGDQKVHQILDVDVILRGLKCSSSCLSHAIGSLKRLMSLEHSGPHVDPKSALNFLLERMERFPERTFPPENDTCLGEHCRFSGAVGFLIAGNLVAKGQVLGLPPAQKDPSDGKWNVSGKSLRSVLEKMEFPSLQGHLVKVHFRGAEERFRSALRLDDLHGLLAFLGGDRKQGDSRPFLRREFDREFGRGLRELFFKQKGEGAWEAVAPIQETPFELLYLLPGAIEKEKVVEVVQEAYDRALKSMAEKLAEECGRDFRGMEDAPWFEPGELLASLRGLGLGIAVDTFEPEESPSSKGIPKAFSEALLASYGRVQGPVGEASAPKPKQILSSAAGESVVPCAVCQLSPVFEAFYERLGESGGELLRKVVYDEKEDRLCQGCLAIRVRSHMRVQVNGLSGLIIECGDSMVRFEESDEGPPLPRSGAAALPVQVRLEGNEEFGETDFAFLRKRRGRGWDIFPTLGYAADSWSNVVLLEGAPCRQGVLSNPLIQKPLGSLKGWDVVRRLCEEPNPVVKAAESHKTSRGSSKFGPEHQGTLELGAKLRDLWNEPLEVLLPKASLPDPTVNGWQLHLIDHYFHAQVPDGVRGQVARSFWGHQLRLLCSKPGTDNRKKGEKFAEIDLHMARLLERIRSVGNFYEKLLERLRAARIPTLPLETSYPRLLLAAPADRLPEILTVVLAGLGEDLLGYPTFDPEKAEHVEDLLEILEGHVPPVLGMVFSVFKKKQPLYQVMAASERMAAELAEVQPQTSEGDWDWRCAHLGFRDLRGSLSIHGSPQVKVEFKKALRLLPVVKRPEVDRRSLARVGPVRQEGDLDRQARLEVLADRRRWVKLLDPGKWDRAIPEALADKAGFDLVSFLAHVARR